MHSRLFVDLKFPVALRKPIFLVASLLPQLPLLFTLEVSIFTFFARDRTILFAVDSSGKLIDICWYEVETCFSGELFLLVQVLQYAIYYFFFVSKSVLFIDRRAPNPIHFYVYVSTFLHDLSIMQKTTKKNRCYDLIPNPCM